MRPLALRRGVEVIAVLFKSPLPSFGPTGIARIEALEHRRELVITTLARGSGTTTWLAVFLVRPFGRERLTAAAAQNACQKRTCAFWRAISD